MRLIMPRTEEQKKERNIRDSKNREYLKIVHRCRECKKIDAYTMIGRTFCADCVARNTELKREKYNSEKCKEIQKKIREQRKSEHKCVYCGKKLKDGYAFATCDLCREKQRERKRIRDAKKNNNYPRGGNGICWQCNKEPCIDGKHLCQSCYDNKMKIIDKMNDINRKEKEFIWTMAAMWSMKTVKYERELD